MMNPTGVFAATTLLLFWTFMLSPTQELQLKEDTCNNSFNYESVDFGPLFPKLFKDPKAREQAYGPQDPTFNLENPKIFYINSKIPEQRFIICLTPKSGSTRFKLLLYRILHKRYRGQKINFVDEWKYNPLVIQGEEKVEKLLNNTNIPRFQIVRNPYTRAISMYENKIMSGEEATKRYYKETLNYPQDKNMTFDQFVETLYEIYAKPSTNAVGYVYIDKHFQPQNKLCKKHLGMSYNYIVKMESMDDWYNCFVDKVKIEQEAMHGWWKHDKCFFSTTQRPCNGPAHREGVVINDTLLNYQTAHNDKTRIIDYYKNETILRMVSEMFSEDFATYGYQIIKNVQNF